MFPSVAMLSGNAPEQPHTHTAAGPGFDCSKPGAPYGQYALPQFPPADMPQNYQVPYWSRDTIVDPAAEKVPTPQIPSLQGLPAGLMQRMLDPMFGAGVKAEPVPHAVSTEEGEGDALTPSAKRARGEEQDEHSGSPESVAR
eukprot:TRINITY_DN5796_c0_g1_i1.p1 TRINITY_DN5796_c0_g1~~TRINITY_DN5796_c0_g1_i1.p1  ORF type:complete len:142 (+),score=10.56 TRINITY_DN5796_c0_g1_i1:3-428(+)